MSTQVRSLACIFVVVALLAPTDSALAGPCAGTSCTLGGAIRMQVGRDLPMPISPNPARTGPIGFGQEGLIVPTAAATVMQTLAPGAGPRQLTLPLAAFHFDAVQSSLPFVNFNAAIFSAQTNLTFDMPHPGTTKLGAAAVTQEFGGPVPSAAANVFAAGGRVGAATVSFYADATTQGGTPATNFGAVFPVTAMAGDTANPPINGVARFTATSNQFGGSAISRVMGTAKIFRNGGQLSPALDLPCKVVATPAQGTNAQGFFVPFKTGTDCAFTLSVVDFTGSDATVAVVGAQFGAELAKPAYMTATGAFTGTIGFAGTILGTGAPVTVVGAVVPFTGEPANTAGFPLTTGMLSITVTDVGLGNLTEMFIRTGTDKRTAAGEGVVSMVTGSLSTRALDHPGANRGYVTILVPEASAILSAGSAMFALLGVYSLTRRRSQR